MKILDPWNQQLFEMIGRCKAVSRIQPSPQGRQSMSAAVIESEWQREDENCAAQIKRAISQVATRESKSAAIISSEVNKAKVIHDFSPR